MFAHKESSSNSKPLKCSFPILFKKYKYYKPPYSSAN